MDMLSRRRLSGVDGVAVGGRARTSSLSARGVLSEAYFADTCFGGGLPLAKFAAAHSPEKFAHSNVPSNHCAPYARQIPRIAVCSCAQRIAMSV